jgi:CDP-diacylglycerol--serine O-phosphatidyltransferase
VSDPVKKVAILPTLLTLGNAVCGFASIHFASKVVRDSPEPDVSHYFWISGGLIFAAMVFDVLDGLAARLSKTASDFGGQLDSLADGISFGLAPAFLLLRLCQEWDRPPLKHGVVVVAGLYMVCTLLRLARFNLENTPDPAAHKRFKGLPSPAAAGCLASLALLRADLATNWSGIDDNAVRAFVKGFAPAGALCVALLMVSRLSYPHLTRRMRGRRGFHVIVQAVLLLFVVALLPAPGFFALFWGYALHAPVRYALSRALPGHPAQPRPGIDDAPRP